MSIPDWVERQIRQAEAAGAFENLPGAGQPIPDLDVDRPELAWVAGYLHRENVDAAGLLPPALALAKEIETLPQRLRPVRSEAQARAIIEDLNRRIDRAHAAPQTGPPLRVKRVKVDAVLDEWRAARPTPAIAAPDPLPPAERRRRPWWPRRARRVRADQDQGRI